jgi:hypothetical protein
MVHINHPIGNEPPRRPDPTTPALRPRGYVGETASEHPFIVGTVAIAFLGGLLNAAVGAGRDRRRSDWREQARSWRDRGVGMGDRARSVAPDVSKAVDDAGEYFSQSVRENRMSGRP